MKIKEIPVIIASPGRKFVTVINTTDGGLRCSGDVTVDGFHDSALWQ